MPDGQSNQQTNMSLDESVNSSDPIAAPADQHSADSAYQARPQTHWNMWTEVRSIPNGCFIRL